jgi:transcriptional regulator with XRE-family HTH domain
VVKYHRIKLNGVNVLENKKTVSCFLKKVGSNMREIRMGRNMTPLQMAQALNMAKVSYGAVERGQKGTTLKILFNIASILDVSVAQLLLDKDEIFLTKKDIIAFYAQGKNA